MLPSGKALSCSFGHVLPWLPRLPAGAIFTGGQATTSWSMAIRFSCSASRDYALLDIAAQSVTTGGFLAVQDFPHFITLGSRREGVLEEGRFCLQDAVTLARISGIDCAALPAAPSLPDGGGRE